MATRPFRIRYIIRTLLRARRQWRRQAVKTDRSVVIQHMLLANK